MIGFDYADLARDHDAWRAAQERAERRRMEGSTCSGCSRYLPVPRWMIGADVGDWGCCEDQGCYVCGDDPAPDSACCGERFE